MATIEYKSGEKILIILIFLSLIFYPNCSGTRIERLSVEPAGQKFIQASNNIPFLKLHMKNGDVYVLENWNINQKNNYVFGNGRLLDYNREFLKDGSFEVQINEIVLAETNIISSSAASLTLTILTVITGIVAVICLTNPKACFGSCPTFYVNNGNDYIIQAEGFSSSIAPSLEEKDIDALYHTKPISRYFEIELRNEAFETQVIRSANVLAVPRLNEGRVFVSPQGKFYQVSNLREASAAIADEGDCSEKFCSFDGYERFSPADSNDLAAKEEIELTFRNITAGSKGLVIASRQTLLTTFLFYEGLAYMGSKAGEWLANLERNTDAYKQLMDQPRKVLGNIEVLMQNSDGVWEKIDETGEHGPIATDIKVVPLKNIIDDSSLKVKLRMTKGLWRIDYIALADLGDEVEPLLIEPDDAFPRFSGLSKVTELLTNPDSVLVTFPGDRYFLNYTLPENYKDNELFLESQGYYLEWMREEWLADESPEKVYQMFLNPRQFFKDLAPRFKGIEAWMEETFWSSKYVHP